MLGYMHPEWGHGHDKEISLYFDDYDLNDTPWRSTLLHVQSVSNVTWWEIKVRWSRCSRQLMGPVRQSGFKISHDKT